MPLAKTILHLLRTRDTATDDYSIGFHGRLLRHALRDVKATFNASRKAQAVATRWRLGDLRNYGWHDQTGRMGDKGRQVFAYEHYLPVFELQQRIEALRNPTEPAIRRVVSQASIVWLLREEDDDLTRLGYRSRRPDPAAAYREAGVTFAYRWPRGFSV